MTPGNDACTNSTRRKKGVRTQSFAQTPRLNLFKNMRARGRMNTRGRISWYETSCAGVPETLVSSCESLSLANGEDAPGESSSIYP
jgi:hypothetical protein